MCTRSGCSRADRADDVARHPRADVEAAADATGAGRRAGRAPRRSAVASVPGTSSPRKRASTPRSRSAGSSASRCPSEPLTPVSLWRWRTFTRSSRAVDRLDLVGHPADREARAHVARPRARPIRARSSGSRAEQREPVGQRGRVADRLEVAALAVPDDGRRAAGAGRDDRARRRERLDRDDRRALVRRRQQEGVERRVPGADALLEADEPAAVGDAELGRERLHVGAVLAVADEHEQRVDALVQRARAACGQVERPLDRGQAAGPADDERVLAGADLGAQRAPRLVVRLAPRAARSKP